MEWLDTFLDFVYSHPTGQLLSSLFSGVVSSGLYVWLTRRPDSSDNRSWAWIGGLLKRWALIGMALSLVLYGFAELLHFHAQAQPSADIKTSISPTEPVKTSSLEPRPKAQSAAHTHAGSRPHHAEVQHNTITVHVSGNVATPIQQAIRSSMESLLMEDGMIISAHKSGQTSFRIEVLLSQELMNNTDTYGSALYSAGCSATIHVINVAQGSVIAVQTLQPPKHAVGVDSHQAVMNCIKGIKPDIEHFIDTNVTHHSQ